MQIEVHRLLTVSQRLNSVVMLSKKRSLNHSAPQLKSLIYREDRVFLGYTLPSPHKTIHFAKIGQSRNHRGRASSCH